MLSFEAVQQARAARGDGALLLLHLLLLLLLLLLLQREDGALGRRPGRARLGALLPRAPVQAAGGCRQEEAERAAFSVAQETHTTALPQGPRAPRPATHGGGRRPRGRPPPGGWGRPRSRP